MLWGGLQLCSVPCGTAPGVAGMLELWALQGCTFTNQEKALGFCKKSFFFYPLCSVQGFTGLISCHKCMFYSILAS